ncbi:metallophosphoesterase [Devosia pacifica]|nr:metallophosphoesterase [Devosia pacifica]
MREHDEHIVEMWNSFIGKSDTVYHLGDAFFWKLPVEDMQRIFKRLNGRKHLLIGNHDTPEVETLGWEGIHRGPVHFKDAATGQKVIAAHHPLREWDGWHTGAVHIHGHTHNNLPSSRRSLDIGIDSVGYMPLTIDEIFTHMSALPDLDFRGVEIPDINPSKDAASGYGR